ncbi:hypothetical protein ASZ90_015102 [hydrocarbon metagenome]|uniref:YkgJ family cysteine cluster protein n=1 Tax=hydrocarbon metagenome TaxID=938273 RepID=A0A0W8F324_9ZZZZ
MIGKTTGERGEREKISCHEKRERILFRGLSRDACGSVPVVMITSTEQDCLQCGRCCERWGWGQKGIVEDIIPWIIQNRQDILQHVSVWFTDGQRVSGSALTRDDLARIARIRYWQDPDGKELRRCPFFWRSDDGRSWCRIHDLKPRVCREFTPWNWKNLEYYGNCPACRDKAP